MIMKYERSGGGLSSKPKPSTASSLTLPSGRVGDNPPELSRTDAKHFCLNKKAHKLASCHVQLRAWWRVPSASMGPRQSQQNRCPQCAVSPNGLWAHGLPGWLRVQRRHSSSPPRPQHAMTSQPSVLLRGRPHPLPGHRLTSTAPASSAASSPRSTRSASAAS